MVQKINPIQPWGVNGPPLLFPKDAILGSVHVISSEVLNDLRQCWLQSLKLHNLYYHNGEL